MADTTKLREGPGWGALNKLALLWTIGSIILSSVGAIVATYTYINDLLGRITRLENQVAAIDKALSFEDKSVPKNVVFNGLDGELRCPSGSIMRGIRISSSADWTNQNPNGSIDCINITPTPSK
jgi:hypothetical protein